MSNMKMSEGTYLLVLYRPSDHDEYGGYDKDCKYDEAEYYALVKNNLSDFVTDSSVMRAVDRITGRYTIYGGPYEIHLYKAFSTGKIKELDQTHPDFKLMVELTVEENKRLKEEHEARQEAQRVAWKEKHQKEIDARERDQYEALKKKFEGSK